MTTTTATRPVVSARWQLAAFLAIAFGVSWLPALGRLTNPTAAVVLPIGPTIAALVVIWWVRGRPGVRDLLRSTVDVRIGRWWWGAVIPVPVAVAAAAILVLAGAPRPTGADLVAATEGFVVLPLTLVVAGPLGEELGWRGYLLPHLLRRHSPLTATLLLTPVWIAFHLPLMLTNPARYDGWWALTLAGFAVTMTWLHLRSGGSVLLAVVFHAVANTASGAAIRLFEPADQPFAARAVALAWLLVGGYVALALLSGRRR